MPEPPVVDASPLIHLSRIGQIHLLTSLGPTLVVPDPVFKEVLAKASDESSRIVSETSWLQRVSSPPIPTDIVRWDLGAGEAAVLAWSRAHNGSLAVLDDGKARRIAKTLGLPFIGTLGIVLRAKRRGLIPFARPVIDSLVAVGMYVSAAVLAEVFALVDE